MLFTPAQINGGAISWSSSTENSEVNNCIFRQNSAGTSGGALYFAGASSTVSNSSFEGNDAVNGGAIYSSSTMVVSHSNFTQNTATDGGAYYSVASSTEPANIVDCTFDSNSVSADGGAIHQSSGTMLLQRVTFEKNQATGNGGAIYTAAAMNIMGGGLNTNQATDGGGIYIDSYPSSVNIRFAKMDGNAASNDGGAFACVGSAGVFLDFVELSGNTGTKGSAYYCDTCTVASASVNVNSNNDIDCKK